jgi:hypothetical protein
MSGIQKKDDVLYLYLHTFVLNMSKNFRRLWRHLQADDVESESESDGN